MQNNYFIISFVKHILCMGDIMKMKIKSILLTVVPVLIAALLGTLFQILAKVDYETLTKPFLAPPKILFPIVWTIIYILVAISGYLFEKNTSNKEEKLRGLIIYYIGLFFNACWTLFFFTLDLKLFSCIWLVVLYLIVSSNYVVFSKKSKASGYLLIPYLVWLLFALYLNIGITILN